MAGGEYPFHPIVKLPEEYWVFDFTKPTNTTWQCPFEYQIGRYDEHRPGMYNTELFGGERDLHVGLDIGAPIDTPVYAFADGIVFSKGVNLEAGSSGPTIFTEHELALPSSVGSVTSHRQGSFGYCTAIYRLNHSIWLKLASHFLLAK